MKESMGTGFEVVTELSPSNVTHRVIQAMSDDKLDIVSENFVSTYDRYKYVDYPYLPEVCGWSVSL